MRTLLCLPVGFLLVGGAASVASAQEATPVVEGQGYPIGENSEFHPTVGTEVGFTNNVFYENLDLHPSGIFRLVAEGAISSRKVEPEQTDEAVTEPEGEEAAEPATQAVEFRAGGRLTYSEYLSTNSVTRGQRNLGADLSTKLVVAPQGTFSFGAEDRFVRDTRPTNFYSTGGTNRIANSLTLGLVYQPGGHTMKGGVRWENQIDYFEDSDQRFANRMINAIHGNYEWMIFPYTKLFADVSYAFVGGLGSDGGAVAALKNSAQPIRGGAGIATAITERFTVKANVGWAYASYADGFGYNLPFLGTELGFRYSPTGRVVGEYQWDHRDSINGDFYRDHALLGHVDQQFGRIVGSVAGEIRFREYTGIPMTIGASTRDDLLLAASIKANYVFRDWLAAVAEFRTETDKTDYRSMFGGRPDNPGYDRVEATAGVRAAF